MPKLFKKLSLILLSSILFANSMAMPFTVAAQDTLNNANSASSSTGDSAPSTWYNQSVAEWYGKVYDTENPSEIFGERYTAAQVSWIFFSLASGIWNLIPGNPDLTIYCYTNKDIIKCGEVFQETIKKINPLATEPNNTNGFVAFLSVIDNSPISGLKYTKNLIDKFNPVSEVQAQGFGFNNAAKSIQFIWTATRNISYALIVLAVIVMAFMIMFRVKISPQLVISVQSALPNIILSTVLITFSYAIAGFAIDLMYVVVGLIASLLTSTGFSNDTFAELFKELTTGHGVITIMYQYWVAFVYTALLNIFTSETDFVIAILMFILAFISILFILFWSLKIIFVVIKNYAMLILTIVTGPLEILVGAITGRSTFGSWFKKLAAQLAVYPLIGLIFFFSFFFLWQGNDNGTGTGYAESMAFNVKQNLIADNDWVPPFTKLNGSTDSGPSASDGLIWLAVSFMIFSQATKAIEIVQSAISGKPFAYGSAIGEATEGSGSMVKSVSGYLPTGPKEMVSAVGDLTTMIGRSISKG